MNLLRTLILATLGSLSIAETITYVCVPSAYTRICVLEDVYYERNGTTTHVFPQNQQHIRVGHMGTWQTVHSHIPHFDDMLYVLLGKPPVVEIMNSGIQTLEIPTTLKHANFADNSIRSSSVKDDVEPALVYLDLSQNWMAQLPKGIDSLINLEVLNLGSNMIETIPSLKNLTKLRVVNLYYNNLRRFSTQLFPTSLTHLDLYSNNVDLLKYAELHFPALEVLNLERNKLKQIDTSELILAMPRLRTVRFGGNVFGEGDFQSAVGVLRRYNISYRDEADEESCFYDELKVEGVCIQKLPEAMGVAQAVVFTVMVLVIGVLFVLVTRWVLRAMSK